MVAVKDFYWEKREGKWRIRWCPLGEGMVDWPAVLKRLARAGFAGPLTLHVEYENPDELKAAAADAAVLRKLVQEAWS
jgi:sugar phosphate isomerase/epimerase